MLNSGSKQTLAGLKPPPPNTHTKALPSQPDVQLPEHEKNHWDPRQQGAESGFKEMEVLKFWNTWQWDFVLLFVCFLNPLHTNVKNLFKSVFGGTVPEACRGAAPAKALSRGSACRRGTDPGSQPRRLWRAEPCSGWCSPLGRCSPWMEQTGGWGAKEHRSLSCNKLSKADQNHQIEADLAAWVWVALVPAVLLCTRDETVTAECATNQSTHANMLASMFFVRMFIKESQYWHDTRPICSSVSFNNL